MVILQQWKVAQLDRLFLQYDFSAEVVRQISSVELVIADEDKGSQGHMFLLSSFRRFYNTARIQEIS